MRIIDTEKFELFGSVRKKRVKRETKLMDGLGASTPPRESNRERDADRFIQSRLSHLIAAMRATQSDAHRAKIRRASPFSRFLFFSSPLFFYSFLSSSRRDRH